MCIVVVVISIVIIKGIVIKCVNRLNNSKILFKNFVYVVKKVSIEGIGRFKFYLLLLN